ncbi:MAG TPA: HYR domain-containing protein [Candidatus Acidoferrum sp.]|nr:HYR domain-containing protein [Candidatus Acidoferrum sp.]
MKTNLHRRRWGEWWRRTGLKAFLFITRFRGAPPVSAPTAIGPNQFLPAAACFRFVITGVFAGLLLAAAPVANAQIANDVCTGAINLTSGTPFTMSTAGASSTGDPTPTCQANFGGGVWFKYTPTGSGLVTVSTCGSSFDTVEEVYTGTCAALTPIACDDDNGPACAGVQASVSFFGTAGQVYYILAGGYNKTTGTLQIVAGLANDQCSGAIPLAACQPYTMSTADATSTGDPAPTCQTTFGKGVWFSYQPSSPGRVTFSTCGSSFDTVVQVYTGGCGNSIPVAGGCDDDNGPVCSGVTASVTITGAVGTVYYILVGGYNSASGTLQMSVLLPDPMITCPANLVFNTDPGTCSKSNVTYSATATENCTNLPVAFNPPSGSTFPKGTNTVTAIATDATGKNAVCFFTVTVLDNQAPRLICPTNMVVGTDPGTCSKSNVTYTATATDNCDASVLLYFSPPSGSTFAKGTNTVLCFASDSAGNGTNCSFTVTVLDTQPPQIACPGNLTFLVDPGTCSKSKVTYFATATDNCDQGVPVVFSPPSGSTFPKGTNIVRVSATDSSGNTGTCAFTVTVLDYISLQCQTDRVVAATSTAGAVLRYSVVASDNCDPTLSLTSSPPAGSTLPYGTTPVACIASTASGNNTVCGFNVTVVTPSCCQGKFWSLTDTSSPGNRYGHAMAYDSVRGRVVLFGGSGVGGLLGDTWEWNGLTWTLMATSGPSPRVFTAMAYDDRIGRTILFGGQAVSGSVLNDTWSWDGTSWQQVGGPVPPPPRQAHAMAFDSARKRTVLFGGISSATTALGDLWEFDGAQWLSVTLGAVSPGARAGHVMAYGSAQAQLLLFGGTPDGKAFLGDTWKWDGANWTLLASNGPGPREFSALAYNDNCDAAVLFGGLQGTNYLSDTWEWSGTAWTLTGTNNPFARAAHAMAHDSANGSTVLFGGTSSQGTLGDTHLYGPSQTPPQIVSTYAACNENRLVIAFNKPMDPASVQNINNYTLACAGVANPIVQAVLTDDGRIVVLTTAQPITGSPTVGCCSLIIGVLRDACGHLLRGFQGTICCTSEPCTRGSAGTEYWLTFPGNYAPDPTNPPAPQLFIAGSPGVLGAVSMPLLTPPFLALFSIPASGMATVTLPASADLANANDVIQSNGIHVAASQPVSVYGLNHIKYTTDAYLGLSTKALGQTYLVLTYQNQNVGVPELNGVQFAIAATVDGTKVTIVPSETVGAHSAGIPFSLVLNRGQTYQLRNTNDAPADLTGTIVVADHPIAVFGSHQCANIPNANTFFCDYLVEQIPPTDVWGRNFITVPLATRLNGDTFHFMAMFNGTTVQVNGSLLPGSINRGQFYEVQLTSPAQVSSSQPILVAQYSDSSDFDGVTSSDPFMVLVPPIVGYSARYTVQTPTVDFSGNYLNLMAPTAAVGQINLDGAAISPALFSPVGASGFSSAQVAVGTGPHTLFSSNSLAFGLIAYGWNLYDSYGYPGGTCNTPQGQPRGFTCPPTNTVVQAGAGCVGVMPDLSSQIGNNNLAVAIIQNPPAGSLLPPGTYPVSIIIVDQFGTRTPCSSSVTVNNGTSPGLVCPQNIFTNCSGPAGQVVFYQVGICNTNFGLSTTPPSGSLFPPGVTVVSCVASNAAGVTETCTFTVTVNCVTMGISQAGANLTINWTGTGTLQKAASVSGPWITISNTTSPYRISISGTQGFFRVKQ